MILESIVKLYEKIRKEYFMYDTIIIGGGPAGLTAAIYLARALKKVLVIERETFGGQIIKATEVENYPGIGKITGMDLGNSFYEQAKAMGAETIYDEVIKIEKKVDSFLVQAKQEVYEGLSVIFATGSSARKLELENEANLIGHGISYCATCDGAFFKKRDVCVIGGGNTAVSDAIYLSNICRKVYLIHRREEFRAEPIKIQLLKEKRNVEIIYSSTVKKILGEKKVEGVKLLINKEEKEISVEGVFVAIGSKPNTSILKDFVTCDVNGYVLTNHSLETSIPGFYVAGDIRKKNVRQLTTATSDGTIAAMEVLEYLDTL